MRSSVFNVSCLSAALVGASIAQASIIWQWSFDTGPAVEAGTFVTDGDLVGGMLPAGDYTIDDATFMVTASRFAEAVGATYSDAQPTQGLTWDGSGPTAFWRLSGEETNGFSYTADTPSQTRYVFFAGANLLGVLTNPYLTLYHPGPLTLTYQQLPEPSTLALLLGLSSLTVLRPRPKPSDKTEKGTKPASAG